MKKVLLFFALAVLCAGAAFGQKKTFIRDYLYQASERDSKVAAREAAMQQMQVLLLKEIGQVIQSEEALRKQSVLKDGKENFSESFSQEVMAITAGFVEMQILDESWNGKTYYIEAKMTVDPKEVSQRVANVLDDRKKERELAAAQKKEEKNEKPQSTPAGLKLGRVTWAACNVDSYQKFAAIPDMYTKFYQWNRSTAWTATDNVSKRERRITDRAWTINPCPAGWRLPTQKEFEILSNMGSTWAYAFARGNEVDGRFYGPNHATCTLPSNMENCVFLPAVGYRSYSDGVLNGQGSHGLYWSATEYNSRRGYRLSCGNLLSYPVGDDKAYFFSVRCVQGVQ